MSCIGQLTVTGEQSSGNAQTDVNNPHHCNKRLEGKVALITGGGGGIGESMARLFRRHGAKVCIVDIQDELGQQVCQSLDGDGDCCYLHCDVTSEDEIRRAVDFAVEKYGSLDIMVNNAGIIGPPIKDIREVDSGEFMAVVEVNMKGVFLGMKHAARVMIPRGKGCIVSLASVASEMGGLGPHSYTGSKHAVVGLTRNVAAELGQHGIRVNCVSPYAVPTRMSMAYMLDSAVEEFERLAERKGNLKGVVLGPEDIAEAALYLASDEARYVSGQNLVVDGGFTRVNNSFQIFT